MVIKADIALTRALGNLIRQTDNPHLPSNQQRRVSYERDFIGQVLTQHSRSAEQSYQVDYQYDKAGKLLSAINPHSRIALAYDANGQLIKERQTSTLNIAGLQHEYSLALQHDYDELGNRTATTLPDGKVINQLYYGSGHLYNQSLYDPSTDQHIEIRHSERNKLHVEVSRQQGILDSVYTHDPMGRLINQNSSYNDHIVVRRAYQYDTIGQLTDINSQASLIGKDNTVQQHTRNHHYQYDAIGRLTQHKLAGSNTNIIEQFAFDPAGNRASTHSSRVEGTNKQAQTATPKPQGRPTELISQGKRVRYTYDSDGRVVHKTIAANTNQSNNNLVQFKKELTFKYNANKELSQTILTHHKGSDTIVTTTDYYYDAFGRRIHKHSQISQGSNTEQKHTHMLWDGNRAIQEYTDTHVYNTIYDQGSFSPVARLVWLNAILQQAVNDDSDNAVSNHDSSSIQVYHYHNDQLGTPNELTNAKGEVVWLTDYEAWGGRHKEMCWGHILASQDESHARVEGKEVWHDQKLNPLQIEKEHLQPIRFQGQVYDEETGLHYNRFRYYDADMGMFTTRDPVGLMGGNNVFAYAPNPTGWVDPLGLAMYTPGTRAEVLEGQNNARRATSLANKEPVTCSLKNTTSMTNVGVGVSIFAGAGVGAGFGSSCSDEGIKSRCYSTSVCATAGAEASATGSAGQSITNASSSDGWSSGTAVCGAGKGVAGAGGIALFANPYFLVGVMVVGLGVSLWSYFKMSVYNKSTDNLSNIDYWLDFGTFGKRELLTDKYSDKNSYIDSDSNKVLSSFRSAASEVAALALDMRKINIEITIKNSVTSKCNITVEITSYLPISKKDTISYEITTFYKEKEYQYNPYSDHSDFDPSSYIKHPVTVDDSVPLNKLLKVNTQDGVFTRIGQTSRKNQTSKIELPKGLSSYKYTQTEGGYKLLLTFVIYESSFKFDRVDFSLLSAAYDKESGITYTQKIPKSKTVEEKPYVMMRDR